jgi:hypothetical protein
MSSGGQAGLHVFHTDWSVRITCLGRNEQKSDRCGSHVERLTERHRARARVLDMRPP